MSEEWRINILIPIFKNKEYVQSIFKVVKSRKIKLFIHAKK
jgi:hypothetical protein